MRVRRANDCHYCPAWVTGVWLSLGILALLLTGACRRGGAVVDLAPRTAATRGTLTGVVRGAEGASPVVGREVHIVNTDTGARHAAHTTATGGFTMQLPAGKYRIALPLKDGEMFLKRPGIVDLGEGNIDSHTEFVIAPVRASRPRGPAYRLDNGLGSPIT